MISQRRKMYETSVAASEKLAACTSDAERAWWRLSLATDAYGTVDVTDLRRLRLAILGEVTAFPTNEELEVAIDELLGRGLMVEWRQQWKGAARRFLHVVNHDLRQTAKWVRDRSRSERPSPVPPFACCDHAEADCDWDNLIEMRGNARHCAALRGTARQAPEPAWGRHARHCAAAPCAQESEKGLAQGAGADDAPMSFHEAVAEATSRRTLMAMVADLESKYAAALATSQQQADLIDQLTGSARSQSAAVPGGAEGEPLHIGEGSGVGGGAVAGASVAAASPDALDPAGSTTWATDVAAVFDQEPRQPATDGVRSGDAWRDAS